jgi:hypothetical protein
MTSRLFESMSQVRGFSPILFELHSVASEAGYDFRIKQVRNFWEG